MFRPSELWAAPGTAMRRMPLLCHGRAVSTMELWWPRSYMSRLFHGAKASLVSVDCSLVWELDVYHAIHCNMAANDDGLRTESRTTLIVSLAVIFVVFSSISVLLRVYTRTRILRILGPDDVTICIAQVLAIAVSVTTILGGYFAIQSVL